MWLWLWLAGTLAAWRPTARGLIREVPFTIGLPLDIEDLVLLVLLGLILAAFWPALVLWAIVRPYARRALDRINAQSGGDRS